MWKSSARALVEVLQDGFGFPCVRPTRTIWPARTISMCRRRRSAASRFRTGDTVEGYIRSPKDGERYFCPPQGQHDQFRGSRQARHKVHFDNLTPLYPNERFKMELEVPTGKDMTPRIIDLVAPLGKASAPS